MTIVIPYVKQTWTDGSGGGTPISAARLGVLEEGILDASQAPAVLVSHNTTNSCTSNVVTTLACNTESYDQAGGAASTMHDTVTNNTRLTCLYAGVYLVYAGGLSWSSNPTNALVQFSHSAGPTTFGTFNVVADNRIMSATAFRKLAVNEYVELQVRQVSGSTLTIAAGFDFGMVRIA